VRIKLQIEIVQVRFQTVGLRSGWKRMVVGFKSRTVERASEVDMVQWNAWGDGKETKRQRKEPRGIVVDEVIYSILLRRASLVKSCNREGI
jgi:hypothetical protein